MKHLRVFTILLCLTLSMTILSACGDKEPNANSNPSSASGGSTQSENAQNSDAPERGRSQHRACRHGLEH